MNFCLRFSGLIVARKPLLLAAELSATRRRNTLKRVDRELSKGNYRAALSLVKSCGLRGFGAAKQIQSLDDLIIERSYTPSLQTRLDLILDSIKDSIRFTSSGKLSLLELESLMHRKSGDYILNDHLKCMQHEAGHFLVGYLLGVLPKRYKVPTMDDLNQDELAGGRVDFLGLIEENLIQILKWSTISCLNKNLSHKSHCDFGSISFALLLNYAKCSLLVLSVIVGGLVAEHSVFGCSAGLHSDVKKMYIILKRWDLKEDEAESQIKRAALNAVLILDRQYDARSRLAEAMALGRSVGDCIDTIEKALTDPVI
ncbi:hypothetical protein DCAR_0103505 [Daucus carota subsp. sativus]|uniref:Peptidase M41 domain-containing protein n=1 Tax=Daucus carota subsp. sativus TaxID=79200 RepID=A0AAF0W6W5_DAUCS|nr:hypothetical protein DCAR_0103505 [Daucus carota subsp. sativus]